MNKALLEHVKKVAPNITRLSSKNQLELVKYAGKKIDDKQLNALNDVIKFMADRGTRYELKYDSENHVVDMEFNGNKIAVITDPDKKTHRNYGSGIMFTHPFYISAVSNGKPTAQKTQVTKSELINLVRIMVGDTPSSASFFEAKTGNRLTLDVGDYVNAVAFADDKKGYKKSLDEYIFDAKTNLNINDIIAAGYRNGKYKEVTSDYSLNDLFERIELNTLLMRLSEDEIADNFDQIVETAFAELYTDPLDVNHLSSVLDRPAITKDRIVAELLTNKEVRDSYNLSPDTIEILNTMSARPDGSYTPTTVQRDFTEKLSNRLKSLGVTNLRIGWTDESTINMQFDVGSEHFDLIQNNVLLQDEKGYIYFNDKMVIPTQFAQIQNVHKTLGENTVIQRHNDRLLSALVQDVITNVESNTYTTNPSELNALDKYYRGEFVTQLEDYFDDRKLDIYKGKSDEWYANRASLRDAVIHTLTHEKIKYSNTLMDDYSLIKSIKSSKAAIHDIHQKSIRSIEEVDNAYFDMQATHQSTNVGVVRFLPASAQIAEDGHIIAGTPNDSCTLRKWMNENIYDEYASVDRQCMDIGNIYRIHDMEMVRCAFLPAQGLNQDDQIVMAESMASKIISIGKDGARNVKTGDKASAIGGNKGICFVIDSNTEPDTSDELYATKKFMKDNNVDVMMSPTSCMSRTNPAIVKYALNHPEKLFDITLSDGTVFEKAGIEMPLLELNMAVDKKTHAYVDEGCAMTHQHDWLLSANNLPNVRREMADLSTKERLEISERLRMAGYAINPNTSITKITAEDIVNNARIIDVPTPVVAESNGAWHTKANNELLDEVLNQPANTYMRIPKRDIYSYMEHDYIPSDADYYYLPIPASIVSKREYFDVNLNKSATTFDNRKAYSDLFGSIMRLENGLLTKNKLPEEYAADGAVAFDKLIESTEKHLCDKNDNVFATAMQKHLRPNSASCVWYADSRLGLNELSIPAEIAETLRVQNGQYVMLSRHPIIEEHSSIGMKVLINPDRDCEAIAINPCLAPMLRGDFDGDKGVIHTFQNPKCQEELMSIDAYHSLFKPFSSDLEVTTNIDVAAGLNALGVDKLNQENIDAIKDAIDNGVKDLTYIAKPFEEDLHKALYNATPDCKATIIGKDIETMRDRMYRIADIGMKGSHAKVDEYLRYADFDVKEDGSIEELHSKMLYAREKSNQSILNLALKKEATGVTGANAQLLVGAMRGSSDDIDLCRLRIKAALNITEKLTQNALDSKQNADLSMKRAVINSQVIKGLLSGKDARAVVNGDGTVSCITKDKDDDRLTKQLFLERLDEAHKAMGGELDVESANIIADALVNSKGYIRSCADMTKESRNKIDALVYGRYDTMNILKDMSKTGATLYGEINAPLRRKFPSGQLKRVPELTDSVEPETQPVAIIETDAAPTDTPEELPFS